MSRSEQVKDVLAAMTIARDAALKAGLGFNVVINATRKGGFWIVELSSFFGTYHVKINAYNGEVSEFSRVK